MFKEKLKILSIYTIWGVLWYIIEIIIALIIVNKIKGEFKEVIFMMGIAILIISFFITSGNSTHKSGGFLGGLMNANYMANMAVTELEMRRRLDEKKGKFRKEFVNSKNQIVSIIISGIFCVVTNLIYRL